MLEANSALVAAIVALVLVTLLYAIPAWRMAREAERTRLLSILPRVALGVKNLGAGIGFITVGNIGKGSAVNVRATLTFEGLGESREVAFHILSEDETNEYMPKFGEGGEFLRMDELTANCKHVSLIGVMEDALGNEHEINERIDLWNVWEITKTSHRHLPPDYERQTADSLKDIKDEMRKLERLAQNVYYRVWPPVFAEEETPAEQQPSSN